MEENTTLQEVAPVAEPIAEYDSIGGWLILVAIGLILMPFRLGYDMVTEFLPAVSPEVWSALTDKSSAAYNPALATVIVWEVIANLSLLIYALVVIVLFFQRRRFVPKMMIGLYAGSLAIVLLDILLVRLVAPDLTSVGASQMGEIARLVVSCAIWIPYFIVSERVKGTFVY
jgi:hypothetical protein